MSGWFAMKRGITSHHMFKGQPERLAIWAWLLDNACWKDTKHDINGHTVIIPRGSVCASERRIAEEVGVGRQTVRTFLKRLQAEHMATTKLTHGKNVISICNWCKYQTPEDEQKPTTNPRLTHDQPIKEQGNKITTSSYEEDMANQAVEIWNDAAAKCGWSQVQKLSKPRLAAIRGRLRECGGLDGWRAAVTRASRSRFLTGQTSKPFFASFDFITKAANFTKLMEGNYDDRVEHNNRPADRSRGGAHDSLMAGFAAFANSDDSRSGGNHGGGETSFGSCDTAMDCRPRGNPSQPILRLISP